MSDDRRQGQLVVYTGQGKGKTTAALGVVFRALGRNMPVAVVQFIKGKWKTGEWRRADAIEELLFIVTGEGFTWNSDDLSQSATAAQRGWQRAADIISAGDHAIIILDELTFAINYGFVDLDDVLSTIAARPAHVHVIVTGRNAPPALIDAADLVSEMTCIKHPYQDGVPAQEGLDY